MYDVIGLMYNIVIYDNVVGIVVVNFVIYIV